MIINDLHIYVVLAAILFSAAAGFACSDTSEMVEREIFHNTRDMHPYEFENTGCISVTPGQSHDFQTIPLGQRGAFPFELANCSESTDIRVRFEGVEGDEEFSLSYFESPDEALILAPGQSLSLTATFEPIMESSSDVLRASLLFSTNDPEREVLAIDLAGRAGPGCPQPIIEVSQSDGDNLVSSSEEPVFAAEPLDRILLDGSASFDPSGGEIHEVEWSLVEYPEDSNSQLTAPAGSPTNELFLDLAGTYIVELNVTDESDVQACSPARIIIMALVSSDIHIQLVWDTPGDPDRHNDHGSDLDLHFLHPDGHWNQNPYDCNWRNRNPIWGDPDETFDNPTLDIDATQGWGPENINLKQPEPGKTYFVGVNYFTDRGYGPSIATIRVFLYGELSHQITSAPLRSGEFWEVLEITLPSVDQISAIDTFHQGFPEITSLPDE